MRCYSKKPTWMNKKILIVEDNQNIINLIKIYLTKDGYGYIINQTGSGVLETIEKNKIDMVLLDIMLPHANGFELSQEIRKISPVPIIMVTARQEESDKLAGLELGADDYITKPFSPKELVARIKALFRRIDNRFMTLTRGGISLNCDAKTVKSQGRLITLTHKEFIILCLFLKNPGKVFSRNNLIDKVYPMEEDAVYDRAIDVCIARIRKKIGDTNQIIIQTVRGEGYKFNNNL